MARRLDHDICLSELVERFGGVCETGAATISGLASLESAGPADLSFLSAPRHRAEAAITRAAAVVVSPVLADALPAAVARILVDDPYGHFARIARWFATLTQSVPPPQVHRSAVIDPSARLGERVSIGPNCVIEAGASVGDGAILGPGVVLGREVAVGAGSRLHPGVHVYEDCRIGDRCIVHAGTVIGSDGFGFAQQQGTWSKIPQLGAVVIGDDVEIGANCTIDRGALDDTVIGNGCKLDNLIQIAHNVRIGANCALAACVGVAGSARIGDRCMIGGSAGILGHLEICDDVVISAMSLVTRSIRKPGFYSGVFPLMQNTDWEKAAATLRHLPALRTRLRRLEADASGRDLAPEE